MAAFLFFSLLTLILVGETVMILMVLGFLLSINLTRVEDIRLVLFASGLAACQYGGDRKCQTTFDHHSFIP